MNKYTVSMLLAMLVVLASVSLRRTFESVGDSQWTSTATAIGSAPVPPPRKSNLASIGSAPVPPPRKSSLASIRTAPVPLPASSLMLTTAPVPLPPSAQGS